MARPKIAAVVLAAGRSSRMAPCNKLLELVEGKPVIAYAVSAALESGAEPVIVVTGFEAERIVEALRGLKVAVPHDSDGALIILGDMPEIQSGDLKALSGAFTDNQIICVPVRHGRRGNPVL